MASPKTDCAKDREGDGGLFSMKKLESKLDHALEQNAEAKLERFRAQRVIAAATDLVNTIQRVGLLDPEKVESPHDLVADSASWLAFCIKAYFGDQQTEGKTHGALLDA